MLTTLRLDLCFFPLLGKVQPHFFLVLGEVLTFSAFDSCFCVFTVLN